MKKLTLFILVITLAVSAPQTLFAQNASPYWSLAGNSNATTSSKLGTTNSIPLRLMTNNSTRLYINTSGNIGIGTTAPAQKLHVSGNAYVSGNVGIGTTVPATKFEVKRTDGQFLLARFTNGATTGDRTTLIDIQNGDNVIWRYGVGGTGNGISLTNGQFYIERYGLGPVLTIDQSGNVGIGSAPDPYTKLRVNGINGIYGKGNSSSAVTGDGAGSSAGVAGYAADGMGVYGTSQNFYAGYFNGSVYTTGNYQASARKLKQNVTELNGALALISKLQPKQYEYKQDGSYKLMHLPQGRRYGLIAEDVEEVLPGLVKETDFDPNMTQPKDGNASQQPVAEKIHFKALNYTELIPIIIKAMQEQQTENETMKQQVSDQQQQIDQLTQRLNKLEAAQNGKNTLTLSTATLEQNTPNPVSGTTAFRYHLPENLRSATLNITNAKGQLVKTIRLSKEDGQINLDTTTWASGVYNYTLSIAGKPTTTKRLVVVH